MLNNWNSNWFPISSSYSMTPIDSANAWFVYRLRLEVVRLNGFWNSKKKTKIAARKQTHSHVRSTDFADLYYLRLLNYIQCSGASSLYWHTIPETRQGWSIFTIIQFEKWIGVQKMNSQIHRPMEISQTEVERHIVQCIECGRNASRVHYTLCGVSK